MPQHDRHAAEQRERDHPDEHPAHERPAQRRAHHVGHLASVARSLPRFLHEALHGADLRECLLRHRGRLGDLVLHPGADLPQPPAEEHGRTHDDGHDEQRGARELGVREREQRDATQEVEHLACELGDLVTHEPLHRADIGGEPAHELARPTLGEEAGGEAHQVLEQILPQPRDHALAGGREEVSLREVEQALDGEQAHQPERDAVEQRAVVPHEGGVEEIPDDLREREADRGACGEAHRRDEEPPAVRPDPRP